MTCSCFEWPHCILDIIYSIFLQHQQSVSSISSNSMKELWRTLAGESSGGISSNSTLFASVHLFRRLLTILRHHRELEMIPWCFKSKWNRNGILYHEKKFLTSVTKLVETKLQQQGIFKRKVLRAIRKSKKLRRRGRSHHVIMRAAKYDVISVAGTEKLMRLLTREQMRCDVFIYKEELFDILHDTSQYRPWRADTHAQGATRQIWECHQRSHCLISALCKQCHQKNSAQEALWPMPCKDNDSQMPVEILDMQSNADGSSVHFITRTHLTKFIVHWPLKAKQAHEVVSVCWMFSGLDSTQRVQNPRRHRVHKPGC